MYLQRILNLEKLLSKKSHFLFGPRSTGKTSLIREQLSNLVIKIDLLRTDTFLLLQSKPWELENLITAEQQTKTSNIIIIDEIQKIPILLDEVHRLIEEKSMRFLLTGSSARKLKQSGVNLLAGRAWKAELLPLTYKEIPNFNLDKYLLYGGLPPVVLSNDANEELDAYVNTYLKEEIQAESFIRKLQAFSKFLHMAALTSGKMLNFTKISSDCGIPASTIREYYRILEDTLLGYILPAWQKSQKRKAISTAKFYLFDIGVCNILAGTKSLPKNADLYGQAFEHFIAMELRAYISYSRNKLQLSYWQSTHQHEVDFILGDEIAIEVKSSSNIQTKHLKNLAILQEEQICKKYYLVCCDDNHRMYKGIEIIHWRKFLNLLWDKKIQS